MWGGCSVFVYESRGNGRGEEGAEGVGEEDGVCMLWGEGCRRRAGGGVESGGGIRAEKDARDIVLQRPLDNTSWASV